MRYEHILVSAAAGLATITMNRPERRNALSEAHMRELIAALGAAGAQLVASCDLAVAAEEASFATPGGKGGWFCHTPMVAVARAVGGKRALELALTGDPIDARTALAWGLVNRVVPRARLAEETE